MKKSFSYYFKKEFFPLIMIAAAISLSVWSQPLLPDKIVTHWNFYGQPDGWGGKEMNIFLFPGLILFMYLLMTIFVYANPKGEQEKSLSRIYSIFRNLIVMVFLVIYAGTTFSNLGYTINIGVLTGTTIGIMMMVMGNYFGKIRRNAYMGVRTPWTLQSDYVWNKTHRLMGKLFMVWGATLIAVPWLHNALAGFIILLGGLMVILVVSLWYSKKIATEENKKK